MLCLQGQLHRSLQRRQLLLHISFAGRLVVLLHRCLPKRDPARLHPRRAPSRQSLRLDHRVQPFAHAHGR